MSGGQVYRAKSKINDVALHNFPYGPWSVPADIDVRAFWLTVHVVLDILNITVVTIFGVQHRFDDGFTYGHAFWMTVCSTIASTITNVTLMIDYFRTPDFDNSGMDLLRIFFLECSLI